MKDDEIVSYKDGYISDCCSSRIYANTGLCSKCSEHCDFIKLELNPVGGYKPNELMVMTAVSEPKSRIKLRNNQIDDILHTPEFSFISMPGEAECTLKVCNDVSVIDEEAKIYTKSSVEKILNHILSFQSSYGYSTASVIDVDVLVREASKFNLDLNREGKSLI